MLFTKDVASLLNQIGTNNAILEKGDIVSNGATTDNFDDSWVFAMVLLKGHKLILYVSNNGVYFGR